MEMVIADTYQWERATVIAAYAPWTGPSIHTLRGEDDTPVRSSCPFTPTPQLSSFSGLSCYGNQKTGCWVIVWVSGPVPIRAPLCKHAALLEGTRGIQCPDQNNASAHRSKELCTSAAVSETRLREPEAPDTPALLALSQSSPEVVMLINASSLLLPVLSFWAGWYWNGTESLFFSRAGLCSLLTCEVTSSESLTLKICWSNEDDSTFIV